MLSLDQRAIELAAGLGQRLDRGHIHGPAAGRVGLGLIDLRVGRAMDHGPGRQSPHGFQHGGTIGQIERIDIHADGFRLPTGGKAPLPIARPHR